MRAMRISLTVRQHVVLTDHAILIVNGLDRSEAHRLDALDRLDHVVQCRVSDLSADVVSHSEWPRVPPDWSVLIFPKSVITAVRVSWLRGLLARLREAPTKTRVLAGTPFWKRARIASFLLSTGYRLE